MFSLLFISIQDKPDLPNVVHKGKYILTLNIIEKENTMHSYMLIKCSNLIVLVLTNQSSLYSEE